MTVLVEERDQTADAGSASRSEPGQLRRIVDVFRQESDESVEALAARAHVSASSVWRMLSPRHRSSRPPEPDTLDRLAEAMHLKPAVVHAAACLDAGYRIESPEEDPDVTSVEGFDAAWMMAGQGLTAEQRAAILAMVGQLLAPLEMR